MFNHFTKPDYLNASDFCIEVLLRSVRPTHIILRVVFAFEICMMIYGFTVFNLAKPKAIMYIASYVVLALVSIAGDILLTMATKAKGNIRENYKKCIGFAYFYSIVLTLWGMFITYNDVMGSGGYWVLVSILFVFPTFVPVNPVFSCGIIMVGSIFMGVLMWISKGGFSTGLVNIVLMAILACLIVIRHYSTLYNNYYMESKLREQSLRDGLTSMFNRRALNDRLEKNEIKDITTVAILDLDDFKGLNDAFGHQVGDDSLLLVTAYLREYFMDSELYRYGGDEFLILTNEGAQEVTDKIQDINKRLDKVEERFRLGISAGVSTITPDMDINEAIKDADESMYEMKKSIKRIIEKSSQSKE